MFDALLALCARAQSHPAMRERLLTQAQRYACWNTLLERAESVGLAPLAFEHLQATGITIPEDSRNALLALTIRHRRANRIRGSVLAELLSAFQDQGIRALALKGVALANTVYPRPGLRPMRDMDILVREQDARPAQAKLLDLGFVPEHERTGPEEPQHHLPPVQREQDSFSMNGQPAQTLRHEHMLWHIYRHAFGPPLIDQPIRLIWVADFVSLVEKYLDEIDWAEVKHSYPEVWNILPVFHFLTPWSDKTLETLEIQVDRPPKGVGRTFHGWPQSSLAVQRQKGRRRFLLDTFWPSEWWTQLYYGVSRPSLRWWWTRLVGHPLHIAGWLLQYQRTRK